MLSLGYCWFFRKVLLVTQEGEMAQGMEKLRIMLLEDEKAFSKIKSDVQGMLN